MHMRFYRPKTEVFSYVVKLNVWIFFLTSATKSWKESRIFRNGLPLDFFSKGQKTYWDREPEPLKKSASFKTFFFSMAEGSGSGQYIPQDPQSCV